MSPLPPITTGKADIDDVGFSNRPGWVKRFRRSTAGFGCHSQARASLRNRHYGPSIMGSEDEAEPSMGRPCRQFAVRS